jgi:hypothetical protein
MDNKRKLAIVVTHAGAKARAIDLPWLETDYDISDSDRLVLSHEGWRAVADGEGPILAVLERRLLIGLHVSAPEFIGVVGHPGGRDHAAPAESGIDEVEQVTRRIRSFALPTMTLGFWTDHHGNLEEVFAMASSPKGRLHQPVDRRCESSRFAGTVAGSWS